MILWSSLLTFRVFNIGNCSVCCFFFFKQKTAYEMRISDWSSDVCSSDLLGAAFRGGSEIGNRVRHPIGDCDGQGRAAGRAGDSHHSVGEGEGQAAAVRMVEPLQDGEDVVAGRQVELHLPGAVGGGICDDAPRSEEQTSELQSLMRRSHAVFCLK